MKISWTGSTAIVEHGYPVFIVKGGSIVVQPLLENHFLATPSRRMLIRLAMGVGIQVQIKKLTMDDIRRADEVLYVDREENITPVLEVDDTPIWDGKIGVVTTILINRKYKGKL